MATLAFRVMDVPLTFWIGFNAAVLGLLALDLTLFQPATGPRSVGQLVLTTGIWIVLALGFGGWITLHAGAERGLEFFTGYLIEYALSMDNVLLFVLIFGAFGVAAAAQHRVLFWGVVGALVMRGIMVVAGSALLRRFDWIFYVFGAYILYAGVGMFFHKKNPNVENQLVVRLARRVLPVSREAGSKRFTVREDGRRKVTLLFLVLIVIELTDLVFALDSIPAIFGVTTDPFIVYTSNIFAILGLRSFYFLIARAVTSLVYLQPALGCVLLFIGGKMVAREFLPISTGVSLLVVACILVIAIVASVVKTGRGAKGNLAHP